MAAPDEQAKPFEAYVQTVEHIHLVSRLLSSAVVQILRRAITHDRSKLIPPEVEMFAEVTHKLRGLTYGSPEYEACRQEMLGGALGHHYEHNRHHPEFFGKREENPEINDYVAAVYCAIGGGELDEKTLTDCHKLIDMLNRQQAEHTSSINEMNLFDLIEMLVDWIAASKRHDDGNIAESLRYNKNRFFMGDQLAQIFKNTVPWIEDEFSGLKTQKDL